MATLAAILAEIKELRREVQALRQDRQPRGDAPAALEAIVSALPLGVNFTADMVPEYAAINVELHAALDALCVESTQSLGTLFGRIADRPLGNGLIIRRRPKKGRRGVIWRVERAA